MPNVCNPTGVCISEERREALLRWSHRQGVPLLEDDYAADLELDNEEPPSSLRALDGEVIYIATFSKKLIPALRVGFIVCPPALRQRMLPLKHAMDLGTSSLLQYALAEFLERGYMRAHLENLLAAYRRRRDSLEESLRQHLPEEIRWRHASRGLLLWLSLPPGLSPDVVFEEARRKGVLVSPSTLNETGGPALQGGLRLIFTYESPERLAEGGRRLGQVLKILLAGESRKHLSLSGV
jgi:DNA-binding transcriptional MocR family regulator